MYIYSVAMYISSTVCDDRSLLPVHITLIVIGVIVYISGMCVATSLGVVLFKKASSCIGTHRCIMYSMHMYLFHYNCCDICIAVFIRIWYQILIVVSVVITILSLIIWLAMIIYISINGEYNI